MVCNESPSLFRHRCSEQQHQDDSNDVVDGAVFEKKRAHRHATLHHQETCYGVSGLRNERWELHLEFILDIRRILPPNGSCWASTKRPQVLRVSEIMFDTSVYVSRITTHESINHHRTLFYLLFDSLSLLHREFKGIRNEIGTRCRNTKYNLYRVM